MALFALVDQWELSARVRYWFGGFIFTKDSFLLIFSPFISSSLAKLLAMERKHFLSKGGKVEKGGTKTRVGKKEKSSKKDNQSEKQWRCGNDR